MKRIGFHDRDREIKEIKSILEREPSLITFIYGSINSGKTELINHLVKQLPQDYVVFYVNLRGKFITEYKDFVRALFKIERGKEKKELLRKVSEVSVKALKFMGIPITEDIVDLLFKERIYEDVFEFLEDYFTEIAENKNPVLIVDELQVIRDVKVDELLIYKLFNFFVRLTKELHLCHVFAVSSDSLFIEKIYSDAMLQGRCRYLLIDDFDYKNTMDFLEKHGFSDREKEDAWYYCCGKPVYLVELINHKSGGGNVKEKAEEFLKVRITQLRDVLDELNYVKPAIEIGGEIQMVEKEKVLEILKLFMEKESVDFELHRPAKHFLVKKNILFVDPILGEVRPQSRLDLLAIREVVCERGR